MGTPKAPAPSLLIQERDRALLRGLFESRVMMAEHIAALYFDGRTEMTKKRLQKLKAAGLVAERDRLPSEPAILQLGAKGLRFLKESGVLSDYPPASLPTLEKRAQASKLTIAHELDVMSVKASMSAGIRKESRLSVTEFTTWPLLIKFELDGVEWKPDGLLRIEETEPDGTPSEYSFFVEVDRSSEDLETLVRKANAYLDYYKTGGFAVWNGASRADYEKFPFRALFVLQNAARRNNLTERLLQGPRPILSLVWLAAIDDLRRDPLGPVWVAPMDYRDAVAGSPHDIRPAAVRFAYKRQTARDEHIEKSVRKRRMLE